MKIQDTYHDAIHFASASFNSQKPFFLTGGEFRFFNKLVHYYKIQKNITWTSEQIGSHLFITPAAVDSLVKKLRAKGYISTSTTQISEKVKTRTIWINWEKIEELNKIANEYRSLVDDVPSIKAETKETDLEVDLNTLNIEDEPEHQKENKTQPEVSNTEIIVILDCGNRVTVPSKFNKLWIELPTYKQKEILKSNYGQSGFNVELEELEETK
jgi:DNA-binding MarR family transcriptional regulator